MFMSISALEYKLKILCTLSTVVHTVHVKCKLKIFLTQ